MSLQYPMLEEYEEYIAMTPIDRSNLYLHDPMTPLVTKALGTLYSQ